MIQNASIHFKLVLPARQNGRARGDSNPRFWALFALKSMAPKAHVLVLARLRARGHTQITSSFIALGYPTRTRVPCKSKKSRSKRLNSSIRSGVKPDFSVTVVLGALSRALQALLGCKWP